MDSISGLSPNLLWKHFDSLRRIPRPSRHEARARMSIEDWARSRGFHSSQDSYGNLVVKVPATYGCERFPVVILQAHLDMVCERLPDVDFDFQKDEIELCVEGEWVSAKGTTLGADNGIGVAAALAIADDINVAHGPLELLLTVEEELGLRGARELNGELLEGRILLNLDSEDHGFYIGCAGAADIAGRLPIRSAPAPSDCRVGQLAVSGLKGGHSGLLIGENHPSAIKLLALALDAIRRSGVDFGVVDIFGGSSRNAIARDAFAFLWVSISSYEQFLDIVQEEEAFFRHEFAGVEEGLRIGWFENDGQRTRDALDPVDASRILDLLLACPHGVQSMDRTMQGLVESSNNLAMIETAGAEFALTALCRSSSAFAMESVVRQVTGVLRLAGASVNISNSYPGWPPNLSSALLLMAGGVYHRLFGVPPQIRAIHAGLECGVIRERIPGVEALSFGPIIEGVHTPYERVSIASVVSFYKLLVGLVEEVGRGAR